MHRADEARAFARASSEFYPGFKQLIEQRVEAWQQERAKLYEDDEPDADDERLVG